MKKTISLLCIIAVCLITATGCKEDAQSDCKKGSKNLVTENRGQASITNIISNSPADIILSDTTTLFVKAEDNLLSFISTEVSNRTLTVNLQGGCIDNNYPFTVIAPVGELSSIRINGEGNVTTEKHINTSNLSTEIVGSGGIEYKDGNVDQHQIKITGSGSVKARNLITGITQITVSGSGDCYVFAERELNIVITGSGNVFYSGSPRLNLNITGTGKVTKL